MRAVIVNCFDTYENRVELVHSFLKNQGYDVTVIQSDFRHFKKEKRIKKKQDFYFVNTKPYYRNLSARRLHSHYMYAKNAFEIVERIAPDLLYVCVPPNFLSKFAARYKQKNKEMKLILDIIDLWPETLPIKKIKKTPPFKYWALQRDKSLRRADLVITECNLYYNILKSALDGVKTETLYLAKKEIKVVSNAKLDNDEIHLAYLGSINNIVDIPKIKEVINIIKEIKPVTLHIIGGGEKKNELIAAAKSADANVEYHGNIYGSQEKQDIFDRCHLGLNIMKDNVCVGLTMKSIDYFQHGLPIINNIPADTKEIVEKYESGINILEGEDFEQKIKDYILKEKYLNKTNQVKLFQEQFSTDTFFKNMENILNNIL
ncbi:glycosyltransferase [Jeotgalibaca dankookensis]|uniref:glycosyltransferase n=1 Tax=Jeotgalibaca dankookensis TaxID=708126 RepID=UPI0007813371|nr:glycosyltransferase [Jeotgalibaca dankookensis]